MHQSLFLIVFGVVFIRHTLSRAGIDVQSEINGLVRAYEQSSALRMGHTSSRAEEDKIGLCTEDNIRVRKSWVNLSLAEREEYIEAVKCLRHKPALTPVSFASGARHRMDDFTVSHVNQTLFIHFSGWLLPWHRYFVWLYETALRDECGYTGSQPHWDWTQHNDNFTKHPLFDGSEYSLGGNGIYIPHGLVNGTVPGVPAPQVVTRPPGTGGGCVVDGPFANITLNFGPKFPLGDPNLTGLEYRPHCMTRDFLQPLSQQFLTNASVAQLLSQPSMADFRRTLDDAIHFAGHSSIGGDMSDIFTSPQDPVFFFHHAQIDRLWTIWQEQALASRLYATSDTITYANSPPSRNATLPDILDFGYAGESVVMARVMDTLDRDLCYRYE